MHKKNFTIFCLMFSTVSFGVAAMAALVPSIAVGFNVPAHHALKLTWLYMLPYGIVALIWAPLTRLFRVKRILICSTFGFFLSTFLFSISQSINQAFIFRLFMGVFGCSFVPLSLITIGKVVPAGEKAKYIGTFFALSYVSTFLSVLLSGFLHWRIIYAIPAILSLGVFTLVATKLDDFDFRKEKFKITYLETLKDKRALNFFLVIIIASCLYHSLQQRLGVYLSTAFSLNQLMISSIFTVSTLSAIVFEFSGGFIGSRWGNIKIAKIGFIAMSLFALFLIFVKQYEFLLFIIIPWGAGWALTHVGLSAYLTYFPDKILRDASSLNSALRFSCGGLGAFIGGLLVAWTGYRGLFVFVAIGVFLLGYYLKRLIQ